VADRLILLMGNAWCGAAVSGRHDHQDFQLAFPSAPDAERLWRWQVARLPDAKTCLAQNDKHEEKIRP
jgi:hypothetical protein